jgi:hypothetical protein
MRAVGEGEGLQSAAADAHLKESQHAIPNLEILFDLLDSTGVRRADSLMKLSRRGRPLPVRSNS